MKIASYIHNAMTPGMGKIGVLVGLESDSNSPELLELGKQIAMHIAAAKPLAISHDQLPLEDVEREKSILSKQARESGKPEEIIEKMLAGRLNKFYEEVCLLDQTFVIDGESKISKIITNAAEKLNSPVSIVGFALMVLGEGVEKKEEDFAAEVAAVISD